MQFKLIMCNIFATCCNDCFIVAIYVIEDIKCMEWLVITLQSTQTSDSLIKKWVLPLSTTGAFLVLFRDIVDIFCVI